MEAPQRLLSSNAIVGMAFDRIGNLYVADTNNFRVRKIDLQGIVTTFAGSNGQGDSGDNGSATAAKLTRPAGVAAQYNGNVFIADVVGRLRKVSPSGIITTHAGTGDSPKGGDGGPASAAQIMLPGGITRDSAGNLYVVSTQSRVVRKISTSGVITTIAGTGVNADTGDGGLATNAGIVPTSIAADGSSNLYLGDASIIRKISANGIISTIAGNGIYGSSGGQWSCSKRASLVLDPSDSRGFEWRGILY